jgi:hypothetical protein
VTHPTWTLRGLGDGLLLGALTGGAVMMPSAISESTAGGSIIWAFIGALYGALFGMLFGFGAGLLIDVLCLIGAGERWAVAGVMLAALAVAVGALVSDPGVSLLLVTAAAVVVADVIRHLRRDFVRRLA